MNGAVKFLKLSVSLFEKKKMEEKDVFIDLLKTRD
jgi:hypothetical protein